MLKSRFTIVVLAAVFLSCAPGARAGGTEPAPASSAPAAVLPPEVNDIITKVVGTMEGAEKTLTAIKGVYTDLSRLRDDIDGVISKTTQTADGLRPRLADIRSQIDKLGPAPEKGAPAEAPSVAAERARLDNSAYGCPPH